MGLIFALIRNKLSYSKSRRIETIYPDYPLLIFRTAVIKFKSINFQVYVCI
jgi:hypothetical protein